MTRGAQALELDREGVNVVQSPLIGLARVVQDEHPELNCCAVDLDPRAQDFNALFAELFNQDGENEVAYRYRQRFAPRLRKAERPLQWQDNCRSSAAPSFRLQIAQAGAINNLRLQQIELARLQPTQVEVEVHAAALNFRDVMKTLGLYPTDDGGDTLLGDECSGVVSAIGSEVGNVSVGDEAIVIGNGNFAARIITESRFLMPKPKHLTYQEATTLPVVFLTVYYALHHLGQIQKGDRILIQAAAGGVGQAAVQIAKHAGAEVFVTAGNQEKRELLKSLGADHIMNSRNLAFADQVKALTNGTGVDIVLNSLAGDAIAKGIDCLAPYGRFLELGKMDIYQNNKIGLWAFRKNLVFYAIDLGSLMRDKPDLLRSILHTVHDLVERRVLKPLPHRTFPVSRVKEAFRFMAQGRHIGKVVISMRERHIPVYPLPSRRVHFDRQGGYLITGGYGGFGLILARWIGEKGGTVILVGRSGGDEKAKQTVAELRAAGIVVVTEQADVADASQVAELAQRCREQYPPLKGIFHAAMVMDDGIILQLNADRFEKVMAPKVQGVWNLHQAFNEPSLDYFILFSSFSSIVGNAGQSNYVAANFFLDMFAHYRRSLGLPAMAINWGALAEVGFLAANQGVAEQLETRGVKGLKPKEAILMLERIFNEQPVQISPVLA
ncbi:MAG: SDR family NAD(P)-dependent oxidoreductase, partial [Methylococcales bacterium]